MVPGYKVITCYNHIPGMIICLLTIANDRFPGMTKPWFPIILDGEIHSEIPSTFGRQEPSS